MSERMKAPLPEKMTIGECYHPAMACLTQPEADEWFKALVERDMRCFSKTREEAEALERTNIGYFSGYYDSDTAARALRLFRASHPFFGTGRPTDEEAFEAGLRMGREAKS